jgi:hypothetical protein
LETSEQSGRGALQHLDGFHIEDVAVVEAGVAKPVQEIIVADRKAAQIDQVAMRAAFAGIEGDARHILERVLQAADALFLDDRGGHHIDRLRRVEDGVGQQVQ